MGVTVGSVAIQQVSVDFVVAAGVALLTFASPVLAGAVRRVTGSRGAILAVLIAQALAFLALQLIHPIRWRPGCVSCNHWTVSDARPVFNLPGRDTLSDLWALRLAATGNRFLLHRGGRNCFLERRVPC